MLEKTVGEIEAEIEQSERRNEWICKACFFIAGVLAGLSL